jgi:pimeloyl-ACP methyl ester carboxylesterase
MRGYGRSSTYTAHSDFAQELIVQDMLELLDALGRGKAVWIGHDWGSPVVWNMAAHHPDKTAGVASLCVPYLSSGFTLDTVVPLVDRAVYPEAQFPAGQWDYQFFYEESFDKACAGFEADVRNIVKALFRKGDPARVGKPAPTAMVRKAGGWFGGGPCPDVPRDADVLTEADMEAYTAALLRNGFFGPDSWYMNHKANGAYAKRARDGGKLAMPVLFLHGAYDTTCETMTSRLAEPMRRDCSDLTEVVVKSGHWMAQERPVEVNAALARWLAAKLPTYW